MRKINSIILCITILGLFNIRCTKNDESNNNTFNPPEWIIGTWSNKVEQAFLSTYIFTKDNVLLVDVNGEVTDYTESFAKSETTVTELTITEDTYEYIAKFSFKDRFGVDEAQLTFKKQSETEISLDNRLGPDNNRGYYVKVD